MMRNIQITICSLAYLLLVVFLFGCGSDNGAAGAKQYGSLQFSLTATKSTYAHGEAVPISFNVKNVGTQNAIFVAVPVYRIQILQGSQVIWYYPQTGAPESTTITIAPGTTQTFSATWDQTTSGHNNVPPGQYTITGNLEAGELNGVTMSEQEAEQNLSANPIQIVIEQ